jgi:hypothetical protein
MVGQAAVLEITQVQEQVEQETPQILPHHKEIMGVMLEHLRVIMFLVAAAVLVQQELLVRHQAVMVGTEPHLLFLAYLLLMQVAVVVVLILLQRLLEVRVAVEMDQVAHPT